MNRVLIRMICLFLAVAFTAACNDPARPDFTAVSAGLQDSGGGAIDSGGGGVNLRPEPMIPIGAFGALIAQSQGQSPQERIRSERSAFAAARSECLPGSNNFYLDIPEGFRPSFAILMPEGARASKELICSDPDLLEAYSEFSLALWDLQAIGETRSAGSRLIAKTNSLGGPIRVSLSKESLSVAAVDPDYHEPIWYNAATGTIHWKFSGFCRGLDCIVGRKKYSELIHEIAHVFLHRALPGIYPRRPILHNVSAFTRQSDGTFRVSQARSDRLTARSSEVDAFIEGIANALETDSFHQDHPMVENDISLFSIDEDGCYRSDWARSPMLELPFRAPLDQEVWIGSTLRRLFKGGASVPSEEARSGSLDVSRGYYPLVLGTANISRIELFIEAIAAHKPGSLRELALALDRQSSSNIGSRWYREYFFHEASSNENLTPRFSEEIPVNSRGRPMLCGGGQVWEGSLSNLLKREEAEGRRAAYELLATKVGPDALLADIESNLAELPTMVENLQRETNVDFFQVSTALLPTQRGAICSLTFETTFGLQRRLNEESSRGGFATSMHLSNMELFETIESYCSSFTPNARPKQITLLEESSARVRELQGSLRSGNSQRHSENLERWLNLKPQFRQSWSGVIRFARTLQLIREMRDVSAPGR